MSARGKIDIKIKVKKKRKMDIEMDHEDNQLISMSELFNITIEVEGIKSNNERNMIIKTINTLEDVQNVEISSDNSTIHVESYDKDPSKIFELLGQSGYNFSLSNKNKSSFDTQEKVEFKIEGMTCSSCSNTIEHYLSSITGVSKSSINYLFGSGDVWYDPNVVTKEKIKEAIGEIGFEANIIPKNETNVCNISIEGMTCSSCVSIIETYLKNTTGINSAVVDLMTCSGVIEYNTDLIGVREILSAVEDVGFEAKIKQEKRSNEDALKKKEAIRKYTRYFKISMFFFVPSFILMVMMWIEPAMHFLHKRIHNALTIDSFLNFLLATPMQFWIGMVFHIPAYKSLSHRAATMDVLVSLGTWSAYIYSVAALLVGIINPKFESQLFFDTPVMLISFILLGRLLESIAKGKTSEALTKLIQLQAPTATLIVDANKKGEGDTDYSKNEEKEIDTNLVQRGDVIKILPGQKVPIDGVILKGSSSVNESMLTGESMPVSKKPGDKVIGSTINQEGCIYVRATMVGGDTVLSQIVKMMENAQTDKAPIQKLADKISGIFVPIVISLSVFTFVIWMILTSTVVPADWIPKGYNNFLFSLLFGISVLVIACPCSLGLATPTAVMVGTGVGATHGILIKSGAVLQKAHNINAIIFDKTGTLTHGKPEVTDHYIINKNFFTDDNIFFRYLSSAENDSEHPLAKAINAKAKELNVGTLIQVFDWSTVPGNGLQCTIEGKKVKIGNQKWMNNVITKDVVSLVQSYENEGKTVLYVSLDGEISGIIAIADTIREEAASVVSYLKRELGIESYMVTGDNRKTAKTIAKQIGITEVFAEVLPQNKVSKVKELQGQGKNVAMIGDGINDSPALVQADVGIAVGAGTDIAMEAADIVLMRSDLSHIITAIALAKTTYNRIKMNFVWSFLYNGIGIPLSAGILYPFIRPITVHPAIAALAMAGSSITVVLSSLLLRFFKPPNINKKDSFTVKKKDYNLLV